MAVKLELYRVFQEVARMGNISAAAQNLYISQSAVSQSIKQLEEQLQVRLFSRSTRGVVLTSEGKMLLDYVSHGLGLIQCGEEKLAQSRQLLTGELIIGASDTVTKTYLVSRLEAFHQNYPAIQIRILNGTSQMVLDYLHAGQVDIAFASEPKDLVGLVGKIMPFPPGHYYIDGKFVCYADMSKVESVCHDDLETACKKIHEKLVAGIEQREKCGVQARLGAVGDNNGIIIKVHAEVFLHAVRDRLARFDGAGRRRILRLSFANGANSRFFDMVGRIKIRLPCPKAYDGDTLRLHLLEFRVDRQRCGRCNGGTDLG